MTIITPATLPAFPNALFFAATISYKGIGEDDEIIWTNRKAYLSLSAARQHIGKYYHYSDGAIYKTDGKTWELDTLAVWPADCAICDKSFVGMHDRWFGRGNRSAVATYRDRRIAGSKLAIHYNKSAWDQPIVCWECHKTHFEDKTSSSYVNLRDHGSKVIDVARAMTRPTLFEMEPV